MVVTINMFITTIDWPVQNCNNCLYTKLFNTFLCGAIVLSKWKNTKYINNQCEPSIFRRKVSDLRDIDYFTKKQKMSFRKKKYGKMRRIKTNVKSCNVNLFKISHTICKYTRENIRNMKSNVSKIHDKIRYHRLETKLYH